MKRGDGNLWLALLAILVLSWLFLSQPEQQRGGGYRRIWSELGQLMR